MILTALEDVTPGMTLGVGLRNREGHMLLGPGVVLTDEYIKRLADMGYRAVWVDDEDTRDIPYEDSLSDRTRVETARAIVDTISMTAQEAQTLRAVSVKEIKVALESSRLQDLFQDHPTVSRLNTQVDALVGEVLDRVVLTGLGSMRTHATDTYDHCLETAVTAIMLGRLVGLDRKTLKKLAIGCILHDIGNIFVGADLLNKPQRLSREELARMREHTVLGYLFLRDNLKVGALPAHVAYQHHEHQDGGGYPRGLTGNNKIGQGPEIPVPGRITPLAEIAAIADFYDACSSDRPHRGRMAPDEVWHTVKAAAGNHLNREMVELFLEFTPPYPRGTQVMVTAGRWQGYTGVVVSADRTDLHRPQVRVLFDEKGERIQPMDIDLRHEAIDIKGVVRQRLSAAADLESLRS
jgi:HD-GYP domain-containing protein (c-di-GMP phosphodiesterase class II)